MPFESDIILRDGACVHIRPLRPEDSYRLVEIFNRSSPQTIYQRFFSPLPALTPEMARHLSNVDHVRRLALIASSGAEPIGVARYEPACEPGFVELALIITDEWQNRGLGHILLRKVLRAAEANGIRDFCAEVLAENRRMLHLLSVEGQIEDSRTGSGVTTVRLTRRKAA